MDGDLSNLIYSLEIELLRPEVRSSSKRLDELLADDFREFGESGKRYTKQDVLTSLSNPAGVTFAVSEFRARELVPGIVLATYQVEKKSDTGTSSKSLRSSLWQKRDGRWQMVFHQGTSLP